MTKYRAQPMTLDGIRFASKKEAGRYGLLRMLTLSGKVKDLCIHPSFQIELNGKKICKVILDFSYYEDGKLIYEDVKGKDTPMSKLKRKLVEAQYGIKVVLT